MLTLGILGALVGDWAVRNVEMRTLVTRIEASEAAMGDFQDEFQAILAESQGSEALSVEQRAVLDRRLSEAAAKGRDAIATAGDQVAAVRWLAWHREIGRAQDAYLAHNRAWQAYLGRAAKDAQEFGVTQEEVNATFEAAESPIRAAVPALPLFDLAQRVSEIFAPPAPAEGNGQQASFR